MQFKDLDLIDPILNAVSEEGYTTPTPIQQQAIPVILDGNDLLGCAQTGTGKTAAFAIPILQLLSKEPHRAKGKRPIRSLIVTPTRELAIQIEESFKAYGRHLDLRHTVVFGGVKQGGQTAALDKGVDVLVATPGRLLDLIQQGFISLKEIELFVLDEADRMLDMGFINDIKKLLTYLPKKRQSLFFSATMPMEIVTLARTILHDPVKVEVTPVSSTAETIKQFLYYVDKTNKSKLLLHVIEEFDIRHVLVFTRTKHGADKVAKMLSRSGIKAEAIHGDKAQATRQKALGNFKAQTTRVLVATDIAARGIDVDDLKFVINYDIPNLPETYVHRIGRTGRAGAEGTAYSFAAADERDYIKGIQKLTGKKITVVEENPFPSSGAMPVETAGRSQQRGSNARGGGNARGGKPKPQEQKQQPAGAKPEKKQSWFGKKKFRKDR